MSNKSPSEIETADIKLIEPEREEIDFCIKQLQSILDSSEVSESNYKSLNNVIEQLSSMRFRIVSKLLNSVKKGWILDSKGSIKKL